MPNPTHDPQVLYVEDDDDIRALMSDLLVEQGYRITARATAEQALADLQRDHAYRLLLTDYRLPHRNADWLLAEARAQGLLDGLNVIVLSSEINPSGVADFPFLAKPCELNVLLGHVARAVEAPASATPTLVRHHDARISLRLYVSSSMDSFKAERQLRDLLRARSDVELCVFDVSRPDQNVLAAIEEDRIVVTPTLVRRAPGPAMWIIGALSKPDVVEEMLRDIRIAASSAA
jgi:DNA-binding NtrC family response regulator